MPASSLYPLIGIISAFVAFMLVLGFVSVWSNAK